FLAGQALRPAPLCREQRSYVVPPPPVTPCHARSQRRRMPHGSLPARRGRGEAPLRQGDKEAKKAARLGRCSPGSQVAQDPRSAKRKKGAVTLSTAPPWITPGKIGFSGCGEPNGGRLNSLREARIFG